MLGPIGARCDQRFQLRLLCRVQRRRSTRAAARLQAFDPCRVVVMYPVPQRLPIHPTLRRRLAATAAFQDQRQRQKTANLRSVMTLARMMPKLQRRVVRSRHLHSLALDFHEETPPERRRNAAMVSWSGWSLAAMERNATES